MKELKNSTSSLQRDLKTIIKKNSKSAIISEMAALYSSNKTVLIPLSQIKEPSFLSKIPMSDEILNKTIESIKNKGIVTPLVVRRVSNGYQLVVGRRRFHSYLKLNYNSTQCIIADLSDEEACFMSLLNTLEKTKKNQIVISYLYRFLVKKCGYSLTQLSSITGESISQISNHIRILSLPENVINDIALNKISYGQAKAICNLDPTEVNSIVEEIESGDLSVKKVEELVRSYKKNPRTISLENKIISKFNLTGIDIKKKSVNFSFKTNKELQRFLKKMKE